MSSIELTKDQEIEYLRGALRQANTELASLRRLFERRQDFLREIEPKIKSFLDIRSVD